MTDRDTYPVRGACRIQAPNSTGALEETCWDAPSYSGGDDETILVAEPSATFKSYQVGWRVCVNTQRPSYYTITAVSGNTLRVEGDLTSPMVADAGDFGSGVLS